MKENIFWFIAGTLVAVVAFMVSNDIAYGQVTENLTAQPVLNEWVKIVSPIDGQQVSIFELFYLQQSDFQRLVSTILQWNS